MPIEKLFVVDRIEGELAVLVGDGGEEANVPLGQLPSPLHEGTVLRVPIAGESMPDWPAASIDRKETEARRREAETLLRELRRRNEGGDVAL